ncbi:MAG: hypothetical protein ABMA25_23290, partial [Ilumatobacteraceae bacterium]
MYDDDLTPLHELASSHLDGDNSAEERAHVAATPELQSLVASFEDVRARLADVPPAPAAARDSALAAALAAVGVIGVGITTMGGSDSDSTSADTAAKAEFDARIESAESAPQMDLPMSTIGTIGGGGASVATVVNSLDELAALPLPGEGIRIFQIHSPRLKEHE